jgi:putative spermidine/putrescine transport system ATP-binding protein
MLIGRTPPSSRYKMQFQECRNMKMNASALQLDNITKRYGAFTALDHVSLDIREGEFFTLLGPSGSGKSTTLLIIAGFETVTSGEVYLAGKPVSQTPAHKRQIGVVFQSYALFPHLTVFENVAFALRNLNWKEAAIEAQVREMLALVQLEDMGMRLPGQLSGGQQQRVALARSLAFRPKVLLLDEPVGALDRKLREHMLIEFRRIHRALGTTMIYVTHDQEEALVMSDRVGIMHGGKLVRAGAPRDIYENPNDPFIAEFIGETNLVPGTVRSADRISIAEGIDIAVNNGESVGSSVQVAVRPEKVSLSTKPFEAPGWNSVAGSVEEVIYVGDTTKYRVRMSNGHLMRVKQLNCHDSSSYETGDNLFMNWHSADGRVLGNARP